MKKQLSLAIGLALTMVILPSSAFAADACFDGLPIKQYDNMYCPIDGYAVALKNRDYFLLDKNGNQLKKLPYHVVSPMVGVNYYEIWMQNGASIKKGVINHKGDVILPAEYKSIERVTNWKNPKSSVVFSAHKLSGQDAGISFFDGTGKQINNQRYASITVVNAPQIYAIVSNGDQHNFIGYDGKEILGKPYNHIGQIFDNKVIVGYRYAYGENKMGVYDLVAAKEILPVQVDGTIYSYKDGIARVGRWDKSKGTYQTAFMNAQGQYITGYDFDSAEDFIGDIAIVTKNKKVGLIDKSGKIILPIQYKNFGKYSDGMMAVVDSRDKVGFVNHQGRLVIPIEYGAAAPFNNGVAAVYKNGKEFFINKQNQTITKQQYDSVGPYRDGLAQVSKNRKVGLIDTQGVEVVTPQFDRIEFFHNNLAVVRNGLKYGLINNQGKIVLPSEYDFLDENLGKHKATIVGKNGKYSLIDKNGKILLPITYDDISVAKGTNNNFFTFKQGNKSGYLDINGNHYDAIDEIGTATAYRVKQGNKYGIIDGDRVILPVEYDNIGLTTEFGKYIAFGKGGKAGFLNSGDLSVVIAPNYEQTKDFTGKTAFAKQNGKWGMIDNFEKVIIPFKYDDISQRSDGFYLVKAADKYGLIDGNNKVVVPIRFDEIGYFSENLAYVVQNGKYGFIDNQGKIIIEPQFDAPSTLSFGDRVGYFGRAYYSFSGGEAFVVKNKEAFDIDRTGRKIVRQAVAYTGGSYGASGSGTKAGGSHTILEETIKRDNAVFNTEYYYVKMRCANGKNFEMRKNLGSKSDWYAIGDVGFLKSTGYDQLDKAIDSLCR